MTLRDLRERVAHRWSDANVVLEVEQVESAVVFLRREPTHCDSSILPPAGGQVSNTSCWRLFLILLLHACYNPTNRA